MRVDDLSLCDSSDINIFRFMRTPVYHVSFLCYFIQKKTARIIYDTVCFRFQQKQKNHN